MTGTISGLSTAAPELPELFIRLVKEERGALEEAAEPHRCVLHLIIFYTFLEEKIEAVLKITVFLSVQRVV
jgi:hypothetical protein